MTSRRVIRSYYTIAGLYTLAAALIWGVNTLFLLSCGLELMEVFLANTAFSLGSVVFEIPTGVLADTRGRRASFLLSVAILLATTLAYVAIGRFGGGLPAFAAASVVMGLGFTFYSGAVEAWLVDALEATGFNGQLDRVFARGSMVTGAAMLVGTSVGGVLGSLDLALPYLVRSGLLVGVFAVAFLSMRDLGFRPRSLRLKELAPAMRDVARESVTYGWRQRSVRLLMLVSLLQMGFLTWSYHAWQPYFLELLDRRDAVWVAGVIAALISLATIAGNALVDRASRLCTKRTTLLLWAAGVQAAAAIGVGLASSFWLAVPLYLLVAAAMGVTGPAKQAYLHASIPSAQRASVISFESMLANLGAGAGQAGLGQLARARSLAGGYVAGGAATLLALPILFLLRRLREPADRIVGEACGHPETPCAALGMPNANLVDSTPRRSVEAGA